MKQQTPKSYSSPRSESDAPRKASGGSAPASAGALPLFYQSPLVLDANQHREAGILPGAGGFGFARQATAVPLLASEFAAAARHYPIVFADAAGSPVTPLAVLGLHEGQNLFVEADGRWKTGLYIPAYVRRYPFIVSATPDKTQQVVLVDSKAESFVEHAPKHADAWRIFTDEGKPTPAAQTVIDFCRDWVIQADATEAFGAALREQKLLAPNTANLQRASGERYRVDGFAILDQARLAEVPEATLLTWVKQGWYALIVLHLASQQNWASLLELSASGSAQAAPSASA